MKTTQPIRDIEDVRRLLAYYLERGMIRNYVLVSVGLNTALRIGDILELIWDDVYDFEKREVKSLIDLSEKKTGKSKVIALNKDVSVALALYAKDNAKPGVPIILSSKTGKTLSRNQAYLIIRKAGEAIGIEERISCHSLRKTFGYHSWRDGFDPLILMDIFNHSSLEVTLRYLGVTQDDKNAVYMGLSFGKTPKPPPPKPRGKSSATPGYINKDWRNCKKSRGKNLFFCDRISLTPQKLVIAMFSG